MHGAVSHTEKTKHPNKTNNTAATLSNRMIFSFRKKLTPFTQNLSALKRQLGCVICFLVREFPINGKSKSSSQAWDGGSCNMQGLRLY